MTTLKCLYFMVRIKIFKVDAEKWINELIKSEWYFSLMIYFYKAKCEYKDSHFRYILLQISSIFMKPECEWIVTWYILSGPLLYLRFTKHNVEKTFIQKPLPVVVKAYIENLSVTSVIESLLFPPILCNSVWHVNVEQNKGLNVFLTK